MPVNMPISTSVFSPPKSSSGPPPSPLLSPSPPPDLDELLQAIKEPRDHLAFLEAEFAKAAVKKFETEFKLTPEIKDLLSLNLELKKYDVLTEFKPPQDITELLSLNLEEIVTDQNTGSKANIISSVVSFFGSLAEKIQRLLQSTFSQDCESNKAAETEKVMGPEVNKIVEDKA